MSLDVHQFACLSDNYGYLIRDRTSGKVASIDTPDADAILGQLAKLGWSLSLVMNTHWHPDHAGGNERLKAETGCEIVGPAEVRRIAPLDRELAEGDTVELGESRFKVMAVGGHTLGHIAYYDANDAVAFVGDTLFALGCGRVFEGDAAMMWGSLSKLAALPDDTTVYCAHEYTASNAKFALSVDDDPALALRAEQVFAARARGEPTVPTTIGAEKATNPFLRAPVLAGRMGLTGAPDHEVFGAVRAAKDTFR
ncbi:MAG: hydroxyacylglutathione hydrolase [Caulobacterales bacterium 32-69-10]|nr:MAG: hydroxyacylglutathione hydrolase [Caulobacterales bacterium 32-69-10]